MRTKLSRIVAVEVQFVKPCHCRYFFVAGFSVTRCI